MTDETVIQLGQETLKIIFLLTAPLLLVAMVIGIGVSLLQAVTQINEATLSFVPKILAIAVVLIAGAPWMINVLTSFSTEIFMKIAEMSP